MKDLAALARVSTTFYTTAIRQLYRSIVIDGSPASCKRCFTLTQNDQAAVAVRSIVAEQFEPSHWSVAMIILYVTCASYLACRNSLAGDDIKALIDQIHCVLRRATNLRVLRIFSQEPDYSTMLPCLTFPMLRHLESSTKLDERIHSFLERHPGLRSVCLPSSDRDSFLETCHLPRLEYFSGSATLAQSIVPYSSVHKVSLSWSTAKDGMHLRSIVEALTKSTVPIVSISIFYTGEWSLDVLNIMSACLLHLSSLTVHTGTTARAISPLMVTPLVTISKLKFCVIDSRLLRMTRVLPICLALCPK